VLEREVSAGFSTQTRDSHLGHKGHLMGRELKT